MSDDDRDGSWTANSGITLPDGEEATYNVGLSPFFFSRAGSNGYERMFYGRGRSTSIFASNIGTKGSRYSLDAQLIAIWPSNVMEYQDGRYVLTNPITEANIKAMRNNMDTSDLEGFDAFLERNWGIKPRNEM